MYTAVMRCTLLTLTVKNQMPTASSNPHFSLEKYLPLPSLSISSLFWHMRLFWKWQSMHSFFEELWAFPVGFYRVSSKKAIKTQKYFFDGTGKGTKCSWIHDVTCFSIELLAIDGNDSRIRPASFFTSGTCSVKRSECQCTLIDLCFIRKFTIFSSEI